LLSFLHLIGDVEKRAAGALRVHRAEGARKAVTNSDVLGAAELGRSIRLCIEAIVALLYCAPVDAGEKCYSMRLLRPQVWRAES
jgi:hypothetical protein